ncbi:PIN domain-containing protein [Oscillatoria sp. FACHB-1406]|uniref:type II toxin-antitoxin system VapC family toxin n=1 Tax=Oscillatoria sp. FACHB-1406 TaxID=2692846 RepID=UPI00168389B6|nr:PIN domain-containing protein [Oscillatoria sp. FACHB-1406]MBD2578604.1 PIN domain-containing protein [Oscillatoria sp. FACHB-1406]
MTRYLLDTNILLRAYDLSSSSSEVAVKAISLLLEQGDECVLTAQVLIEFWVVATRPVEVNGLGWNTAKTQDVVEMLLQQFPLLEESDRVFLNWLALVKTGNIIGKRTHDVRLIAVMLSHQVSHLLTFNPSDFTAVSDVVIVHPQELVNRSAT